MKLKQLLLTILYHIQKTKHEIDCFEKTKSLYPDDEY
jgi:hypothetical protein